MDIIISYYLRNATLGEVIYEDREQVGSIDGNGLPVFGVTNIAGVTSTGVAPSEDKSKYISLRPGRFVYNPYRINVGSIGLSSSEQNGIVSPAYVIFATKQNLALTYLYYFLKSVKGHQLINYYGNRGTVRSALRFSDLCKIEIPLPPLSEQQRIVARIEELAVKIEEAKGLRKKAVEEVEAFFASASEYAFKLRSGWYEATIGDFCEQPQYGFTASATTEQIGPRFLRITDIQEGKVNWETVPFCQCPAPKHYLLQNNDIVFARTGATTGKSFLIKDAPEAVFASYLIRLRVQKLVSVDFLYRYFQTPSYWSQIVDNQKGTGQPNVNGTKLSNIRVPIAPPEDQRRIVAYLDGLQAKVDALKRLQAETAAELDAMLPSVLDKAFKGELLD